MNVLGYNGGLDGYPARFGSGHDAAAAMVVDGQLVAAVEEERFSRRKHDSGFPKDAIAFCLRQAGLRDFRDVDLVTYFYSYPLMFRREKYAQNRGRISPWLRPLFKGALAAMKGFNRLAGYGSNARHRRHFEKMLGLRPGTVRFRTVPHHLAHLASSFYDSPFERALCATFDAEGESASGVVAVGEGTRIKLLRQFYAPNSLGYLYQYMTLFLGFDFHDEYRVMGLAPYGDPARFRGWFRNVVQLTSDGGYQVDPVLITWLQAQDAFGLRPHLYPRSMTKALGRPRGLEEPISQRHMDLAASLQGCLEDSVFHVLEHARRQTKERSLCLAGGVALNCTLNGKLARSGLFDRIWIHPAAHDSGTSVGSALFGYHNLLRGPRTPRSNSALLGPSWPQSDIQRALDGVGERVFPRTVPELSTEVARLLAAGKVVGWYQGRMEWGPRALGNRSILADARRDDMKDIVNRAVKLREAFRPFAPAVLAEAATEWFDLTGLPDSPHMLFVVPVRQEKRGLIPAVTHVDGSARVQTVSAEQNPRFHALLTAFHELTGVPLVLNTSFNVQGEPIVNTPSDAVNCFLKTQIDVLVLGDVIVEKRPHVAEALRREGANDRRGTGRLVDGVIAMA